MPQSPALPETKKGLGMSPNATMGKMNSDLQETLNQEQFRNADDSAKKVQDPVKPSQMEIQSKVSNQMGNMGDKLRMLSKGAADASIDI